MDHYLRWSYLSSLDILWAEQWCTRWFCEGIAKEDLCRRAGYNDMAKYLNSSIVFLLFMANHQDLRVGDVVRYEQ